MIRILLVDDHPIVRDGLSAVLESRGTVTITGMAGSAADGAVQAQLLKPDVVIVDLEMPDSRGAQSVQCIHAAIPEARILVFTAYDTEEIVIEAMQNGAKGYILKGSPSDELFTAVETIYRGETYLSPRIAAAVVGRIGRKSYPLTVREKEVLQLIAAGHSSKQAAHSLSISEATVKFHVASIFNKLGASNRAQAVNIALMNKLV